MSNFLDPEYLLATFSYIGIFAIVFAESGLLAGFFLPGDSLLFAAGLFTTRPLPGTDIQFNIVAVCLICTVAAITGDQVGYLFGRKVGPALFRRENSRIFKQKYVEKSQQFFENHGSKTIVLARFVPIVRTFAPVLAGVSRMHYATFIRYNILGGILWGVGVPVAGHYLGKIKFVHENLEVMILIIVAISILPVVIELMRAQLGRRKQPAAQPLASRPEIADDQTVG